MEAFHAWSGALHNSPSQAPPLRHVLKRYGRHTFLVFVPSRFSRSYALVQKVILKMCWIKNFPSEIPIKMFQVSPWQKNEDFTMTANFSQYHTNVLDNLDGK